MWKKPLISIFLLISFCSIVFAFPPSPPATIDTVGGISEVSDDTTPQLGGNLDIQAFSIEGVDATEFGYVNGVTSGIQDQIDSIIVDPAPVIQSPVIQGAATVTTGFAGTVSSSSATITFSDSSDAIVAGYSATTPILGVAITADGQTVYLESWTNSTTATANIAPSPAWSSDSITSIQYPISSGITDTGDLKEYLRANGVKVFKGDVEITPILNGDMELNEQNIVYDSSLSSDHSWCGEIETGTLGETIVFGELVYWDLSEQKWKKADADQIGTMGRTGIALDGGGDTDSISILIKGYIRDDSWDFTVDDTVKWAYASATDGDITETVPAGAADYVWVVGYIISADKIFFDPGVMWVKVAT